MSGCQVGTAPTQITGVATGAVVGREASAKATILAFVDAFNKKDVNGVVKCVSGAKNTEELRTLFALGPNMPKLSVTITDEAPTPTGSVVTLTSRLAGQAGSTPSAERKEEVTLVREGGDWKIVPYQEDVKDPGYVLGLATMIVHPEIVMAQAQSAAKATSCLSNLKQISLAMLLYMNDHDDKFPKSLVGIEGVLNIYTKNGKIWRCPEDTGTGPSYTFNPAIAGKSATIIAEPALTVLVYEGSKGQLAFRHKGRAAVAFCDGHVKMFTPENAKSLRWTIK